MVIKQNGYLYNSTQGLPQFQRCFQLHTCDRILTQDCMEVILLGFRRVIFSHNSILSRLNSFFQRCLIWFPVLLPVPSWMVEMTSKISFQDVPCFLRVLRVYVCVLDSMKLYWVHLILFHKTISMHPNKSLLKSKVHFFE